ncbi:MAG: NrtA/SsuA/CpmA family ABC transporter substrate-binding protein [Synergistaceae bacterium]|jgi:sulfonate transport system substrate-binding protein|nr:NrtA/SsuA/CpmA family ABC transporter substrate-binding protein [Synergistaceae bacterium]
MRNIAHKFIFTILTLALLIFSARQVFAADGSELNTAKVINVGWQSASSIKHIGTSMGLFEKEFGPDGIVVKFQQFSYGPPIIEGLAADSLDFGEVGDMPIVTAVANGIEIQSIYKTGVNPDSNTLLVPVNSTITSVSELKGKKVGASIGSSGHHYLVLLLAEAGLSVEDVEIVNLGANDLGAALAADEIEAGSTWEPYGTIFTGSGSAKLIAKSGGVKQNTSTVVARKDFVEKNPDITVRYLKVILEIEAFIAEDPERAIKIISKESGFKESDLAGLLVMKYNPHFTDFDWDQMKKTKQFLLANNLITNDYDIRTLYTDKYLIEAEKLCKAMGK